jgi:predicted dehydrogenase
MLPVDELLSAGEIGDLESVEVDMVMAAPPDSDPRWDFDLAGGSVMDVGCYALHVARHLGAWAGGEPTVVEADAVERAGHPGVDERLNAALAYPSGATALVRSDMDSPDFRFGVRLVGSAGAIEVPGFVLPHYDDRVVVTTGAGERVERLGDRPSYEYQLEAFAAAVRDGAPLRNDADDAVAQMQLIDACYVAAGLTPRPTFVPA